MGNRVLALLFSAALLAAAPARPFSTTTVFYVTDQRASTSFERYGFDDDRYGFDMGTCADPALPFTEDCTLQYGVAQWDDPKDPHYYKLQNAAQFFSLLHHPKRALIFIHGFNERFDDAMTDGRTIASWVDYVAKDRSSVPVIVYGWPAAAATYSRLVFAGEYENDDANNTWSRLHLQAFINELRANTPQTCLNVAAHSMGNELAVNLLLALHDETMSAAAQQSGCAPAPSKAPVVAHFISIEPDVDSQTYAEAINYVQGTIGDVTVYGNERDVALSLSAHLHGHCRAGEIFCQPLYPGQFSGAALPPWLNIIDAGSIAFACDPGLGHSYYRYSSIVLGHIADLVVRDAGFLTSTSTPPPPIQFWPMQGNQKLPHYAIDASGCRYQASDA